MQEKIDELRDIIQKQIADSKQQMEALKLLSELEDYTQKTVSSYEIIQNLNHNLRTPIGSILGFSNLLLDQEISGELNQDQYEDLLVIQKSGEALLQIINGLLDFAKVKTTSHQIRPQAISIHNFLEKRRPNFQKIVKENNCILSMNTHDLMTKISVDPWQLYNILKDVLVVACADNKDYTIELRPEVITVNEQSWLEINIKTQGYGIPISTWEERYQAGLVYQEYGTWEGLALPYELCRLMNGRLHVFRESDMSTRYSVRFPVVED